MVEVSSNGPRPSRRRPFPSFTQLVASPGFQRWAARMPLVRRLAARDGAEMFDLVQGFVQSQALMALVRLEIPQLLLDTPLTMSQLAQRTHIPEPRLHILIQAGIAMGLLKRRRDRTVTLARKGAALVGVPGLQAMIRHHDVLYRDLADPVAFFRGPETTELAAFWPYVFGAGREVPGPEAQVYTDLMAQSQQLVAADTLDAISLKGVRQLMDVGGGSGVFLEAASQAAPQLQLALFDLPNVVAEVPDRLKVAESQGRLSVHAGSFKSEALPTGSDAISLVRVLYDHSDDTVRDLLAKTYAALPAGGRLIVSEPMSGGEHPDPTTDVYFAVYTLAMQTGKTRSAAHIKALCEEAGFTGIRITPPRRSYVTQVLTSVKPA
ncbi:methyltransferase [Pseudaestuariivita sp.]|uniref:methyltransferase n=1 Tax=Pseudaestuariivita sp. TaxID=2211669 RepID=UPI004059D891